MRSIILSSLVLSLSAALPTFAAYNLHVTSHVGPSVMHGGEKATYVVTVVNDGPDPSPATYVAARPNTTIKGAPATAKESVFGSSSKMNNGTTGCSTSFYGGICQVSSLAPGASITGTFVMGAPVALGDVTPATVTVIGETGIFDSTGNGIQLDSRNVVTDVTLLSDGSLAATVPSSSTTSDPLAFVVNVHNLGPSIAHNASVTWSTPTGTTFVSVTQSTLSGYIVQPFNCTTPAVGGTGTVTCTRDPLYVDGQPYSTTEPTTLTYTMKAASAGTVTNSATITTSTSDANSSNDTISKQTTIVAANADLVVTNTPNVTDGESGSIVDSTITLRNAGPTISSSTVLSFDWTGDATPFAELACAQVVPIRCRVPSLNPGQTLTFKMSLRMPATLGPFTTTASVPTRAEDPVSSNNTASATITVSPRQANLVSTIDAPATVATPSAFDVTLRVSNSGPRDATNAVVSTTLYSSAGITIAGITSSLSGATCSIDGFVASCRMATLPVGAAMTLTAHVSLTSAASGTVTVDARAYSDLPGGGSVQKVVDITSLPPDLSVSATSTRQTDGSVEVTISATNLGPTPGTTEMLEVPLPAGLGVNNPLPTCWDASLPGWRCSLSGLRPNEKYNLSLSLRGSSPAVMTARVIAPNDPVQSNNTSSTTVDTGPPSADVGIAITGPAQAARNGTATYTAIITNNGPATASTISFSLKLDQAQLTALRNTSTASVACSFMACTIYSLASGSSATFELGVTPSAQPTQTFSITGTVAVLMTTDPVPSNNTATLTGTVTGLHADLAGTMKVDKTTVTPGGTLTYTFTGTNRGPDPSAQVTYNIVPQDGATLLSASSPNVNCDVATIATCFIASLDPGASVVLTALVKAPPAAGTFNTQAQLRSSITFDPDESNNYVIFGEMVAGSSVPAQLTPTLIAPATAPAMGTMTLVATVHDSGGAVTNPRLRFAPPAGSSVDAVAQSGGVPFNCGVVSGTMVCTASSLAPGDSATFTLTVHVGAISGHFVGVLSATSDSASGTTSVDLPIVAGRRRSGPR